MNLPPRPPWREIYDRIAPFLALLVLVVALGAGVATYVNDRNDRERDRAIAAADRARIEDNARLLGCFDDFATTLAGGLPPVRDASAAKDVAVAGAFDALEHLLTKALAGNADEKDAQELLKALAELKAANAALDQARDENPYPSPPSEFCGAAD